MTRAWVALVMALPLVLAGCIGGASDEIETASVDEPTFGELSGLTEMRTGTTLETAPDWAVGEWWTYRMVDHVSGTEETFTLVVAGQEADHYLVGFPADEVPILPFIFHLPGVGQLSKTDLSYEAHDAPFELLGFPLEEGRSWEGVRWSFAPMTITVESVDGGVAELTMESGPNTAAFTYSSQMGAIVHHRVPADEGSPVERELVLERHGFGYEGEVMVPYGQDLTMCHGRALAVMTIEDCATGDPATPSGSFEISGDYTAASFGLIVNRGQAEGEQLPGAGAIMVDTPPGDQVSASAGPGTGNVLEGFHLDDPVGTWEYEAYAPSGGYAIVEGVTYTKVVVDLPTGCFVSDVPNGFAGAPCN